MEKDVHQINVAIRRVIVAKVMITVLFLAILILDYVKQALNVVKRMVKVAQMINAVALNMIIVVLMRNIVLNLVILNTGGI